jgi:hypothetical protein
MCVIIDAVRIGDSIYWTPTQTTRNYNYNAIANPHSLQFTAAST